MHEDATRDAPAEKGAAVKPKAAPEVVQVQATARPHRDKDGKLTHAGMQAVLLKGGSVLHDGKIITSLAELPAEEDLVRHDAEARRALMDELDRQELEIAQRRRKLMAAPDPKTDVPTPAVPTGTPPHPQPPQVPAHAPAQPPQRQPADEPDDADAGDEGKGKKGDTHGPKKR